MNSYAAQTLMAGERILVTARPHRIIFFTPILIVLVAILLSLFGQGITALQVSFFGHSLHQAVSAVFLLVGFYSLIKSYCVYRASEYSITSKRIIMKTGIMQTNALELLLSKLEAVHVGQSMTGRFFNFGSILLVGVGGTKDYFFYVPNPYAFRKHIQEQRED